MFDFKITTKVSSDTNMEVDVKNVQGLDYEHVISKLDKILEDELETLDDASKVVITITKSN